MTTPPNPITPPLSRDEQIAWLRLLRSRRVGPSTFFRLLTEHGSAGLALAELPRIAAAAGVKDYAVCCEAAALAEIRAGKIAGARLSFFGDETYPKALMTIGDAPPVIWTRGVREVLTRRAVAIVGARNASSLGLRTAKLLAGGLSEAGFLVISGLARGIDTVSHHASVRRGTVAVLAGGVDVVYPADNASLMQEITDTGLCLSEQPMGLQPMARHFPRRNRLIAGLAEAVVVIEAAADSGSLITARDALDQGREVLAVPGHPFDARSSGCNMLIRDGATLVRDVRDVIEALGERSVVAPVAAPIPQPKIDVTGLAGEIIARLSVSPLPEGELIRDIPAPSEVTAAHLTELELSGRVTRHSGGVLSLVA